MTQPAQWNTMLKLKSLPYGSIYPVSNQSIEHEVKKVIKKAVDRDCMNDNDIHNKFMVRFREWVMETKLHTVKGLDLFPATAFSTGTTESFDKFFLKHKNRRLRYFKGEYMYHINVGKFYFDEVKVLDDGPIEANDVVVISLPFANSGEKHDLMDSILTQCTELSVPVIVDCSYFHISGGLTFDFTHPCIEEVVFSLSKFLPGLEFMRIGVRFTRKDDDDPLFVYNKNRYVNRLAAATGLEMINRYSADFNYNTYRNAQLEFCEKLGITPTSTVTFGTSTDKFPEYNRGGKENRLCFSKFLYDKILPS